jgi:hypothetical protein
VHSNNFEDAAAIALRILFLISQLMKLQAARAFIPKWRKEDIEHNFAEGIN